MTKITRVSFGFPQNITERINFIDLDDIKKRDWSNKRVKLDVTLDKVLKKAFNEEKLRKEIKESTHAEYLKLTWNYETVSNIRSKEMADKKSPADKFRVYADINRIKYSDSVIEKINDIQDSMMIESFIPSETFTLETLALRGSIGIKDGMGLDEYTVDFTDRKGILAVIGECGSGKSTLIENCHPFPQLLTRTGTLKDHFYLKDSHRILIYLSSSGKRYKIKMSIDGVSKTNGTVYTVYCQDKGSDTWRSLTSVNGNADSYKEWVEHTFGTVDMFLRTSFYAKEQVKGIPDLSRATKSEKMELFSVLAGTDYLSVIQEQAKKRGKEAQDKVSEIKSQLKDFDRIKASLDEYSSRISSDTEERDRLTSLVEADSQELSHYKKEQEEYISVASTLSMLRQNLKAQTELTDSLKREYTAVCHDVSSLESYIENKDSYRQQLEWYEENSRKRIELKELLITNQELSRQEFSRLSELESKTRQMNSEKSSIEKDMTALSYRIESLRKSIVPTDGVCPLCGSPMSEHKKEEIESENRKIQNDIKSLSKSLADKEKELSDIESRISLFDTEPVRKRIDELRNQSDEAQIDIDSIDVYMAELDMDVIRYAVEKAEDDYSDKLIHKQELSARYEQSKAELERLQGLSRNQPVDYSDKIKRLERGIQDSTQRIMELNAEITVLQKQMDSLSAHSDEIKRIESEIAGLQDDMKDYAVIEKAFGNNGIQAIELDSAAPEISDIANTILRESYGDKYTISFDTQRNTSDGRKIDDFIINVFDSESGRIKRLDLLSSGESVWIKQGLYFAFSVLRARRTGFCFRTRFLDESDGSLDSNARARYVKMIETAHEACNAELTVMITHSQEVKDLIPQKIELKKEL